MARKKRSNVEPCSHPSEKCNCGCERPKTQCQNWCNVEPTCKHEQNCDCDCDCDCDYDCDYDCDCDYENDYDCDYDSGCDCNCECDCECNCECNCECDCGCNCGPSDSNCDKCYRLEQLSKERRLEAEQILLKVRKLEAQACMLLKEADELACRAEQCFQKCENKCRTDWTPYCRPCHGHGFHRGDSREGSIKCETKCRPKLKRESN